MQLKDILASLFELWKLMDSPKQERNHFSKIACILGLAESEIKEPGVLSMEIIEQVCMPLNLSYLIMIGKMFLKLPVLLLGISRS